MSFSNLVRGVVLFRLSQFVLMPAAFALMLFLVVGNYFYNQIKTENQYMARYGENWKAAYEAEKGPLGEARGNMAFGAVGAITVGTIAFFIYRMMIPPGPIQPSRSRRKRSR